MVFPLNPYYQFFSWNYYYSGIQTILTQEETGQNQAHLVYFQETYLQNWPALQCRILWNMNFASSFNFQISDANLVQENCIESWDSVIFFGYLLVFWNKMYYWYYSYNFILSFLLESICCCIIRMVGFSFSYSYSVK